MEALFYMYVIRWMAVNQIILVETIDEEYVLRGQLEDYHGMKSWL